MTAPTTPPPSTAEAKQGSTPNPGGFILIALAALLILVGLLVGSSDAGPESFCGSHFDPSTNEICGTPSGTAGVFAFMLIGAGALSAIMSIVVFSLTPRRR
ncbi:hypothetical protein [Cumulibacter soli]|uniref:hypothetical protein n=1 Tax=Cumulibacter soli TaxID=2546344 RepID=UPI001067AECC|nr:hypothetical protein [Cumulibacter soli]